MGKTETGGPRFITDVRVYTHIKAGHQRNRVHLDVVLFSFCALRGVVCIEKLLFLTARLRNDAAPADDATPADDSRLRGLDVPKQRAGGVNII